MTNRRADHPIEPLFIARWSPRAFTDAAVGEDQMMQLFEAARWAPSSMNVQPWRFLYAHRGTPDFERMVGVLMPGNQAWAKHAAVLMLCLSHRHLPAPPGNDPKPSHSHSFDAGSAWMSLALQASRLGLATHGMGGVDFPAAATEFAVPDDYRIECAIAVGHPGDKASLPDPLRKREAPSGRKPVADFASRGNFPG